MSRFRTAVLVALLTLPTGRAAAAPPDLHRRDLLGKVPPELVSEKADWLGDAPPVTLAGHKGKVVWLQFNF